VKDEASISQERPFQGFLDFGTSSHAYSFLDLLRLTIAVTAMTVLANVLAGSEPPWFSRVKALADGAYAWALGLGLFAFVARIRLVLWLWTKAHEFWQQRKARR
jgi:hypothetical protein